MVWLVFAFAKTYSRIIQSKLFSHYKRYFVLLPYSSARSRTCQILGGEGKGGGGNRGN